MSTSAYQWGSPIAPRRALLIHGLTMSSNSWESVAQLLVAEGFFVVAPNLLGHAWRQRGSDYSVSSIAEDLRSYFVMGTSYDVIIGHSLGGPVALSLLPFLPKKEVTVILVDPAIEVPHELAEMFQELFVKEVVTLRTPDEHMAENPAWSRSSCVQRMMGLSMCDSTTIKSLFQRHKPWSFGHLFKNVTPNVKISVLLSDPKSPDTVCRLEHIPRDVKRLDARVIPDTGHWIQSECPNAIMDAIPLPRANL
ncbi:alpha beta-hydrolase [Rhizopogon vinicolor AM-OR11-026]|uniref:Alpha beta-hydrolase n=1 Tax=Rhizopogon vinicolor AM-OR11-026 TaxID=1314800 RepID=A0A1B7N2U9_9AGAM|nr:alpha beta-hydrolase [Rhizopogon vinicolor AM-OR11-026]